ncbi:MAG: sigma-70 family RNA polymerase sigma factor [Bryobacteraceae bacterium]
MATGSLAINSIANHVIPPRGFQDLYQQHAEAVYRTALRVTGNPADAEDVLQTVFLRILDHQLAVNPLRSPERYLRRAATNASIDLLRKKSSQAERPMEEGREFPAPETNPLLKERLRRALSRLPHADAELFVLCYLEGLTYEELAEQFDMERGTVASRLYRIRAVLQKEIEK